MSRFLKSGAVVVLLLFAGLLLAAVVAGRGTFGQIEDRGTPVNESRSREQLRAVAHSRQGRGPECRAE